MPLNNQQINDLQALMARLDALSAASDQEGNAEILDAVYEFVVTVYDRYPDLEDEEEE